MLGKLIRAQTALSAEQRRALARLLDEVGFCVATAALAAKDYPNDQGIQRATKAGCWDSVEETYARVLAEWPEGSSR